MTENINIIHHYQYNHQPKVIINIGINSIGKHISHYINISINKSQIKKFIILKLLIKSIMMDMDLIFIILVTATMNLAYTHKKIRNIFI